MVLLTLPTPVVTTWFTYWPATAGGYQVPNFVGNATIQGTTVNTYQKNGITIDGPGTKAHVMQSTIDGGGQTATIARNGTEVALDETVGDEPAEAEADTTSAIAAANASTSPSVVSQEHIQRTTPSVSSQT